MNRFTIGTAVLAACLTQTARGVVYLENARLKVGVETARGGELTSFEDKLDGDATVGNMVQASGIRPVFRDAEGTLVPGGTSATSARSADGATLTCRCTPTIAESGAAAKASLELVYVLHADYLEVRGTFTDRSGRTHAANHHELPACYAISHLSRFTCCLGDPAWTGAPLTVLDSPPFWGGNGDAYLHPASEETWCAWTSPETGHGLGLYRPRADYLLMGRNPQNGNSKSPSDGTCSYVAPLAACAVPRNGTLTFAYYLAAGTVPALRDLFAGIRFGTADGGYLGHGQVKIAADAARPARFAAFDPSHGTLGLAARVVAANGATSSEDFALVCRTDLADPSTVTNIPVHLDVPATGENTLAALRLNLPDPPPPALFVTGVTETTDADVAQRYVQDGFPSSYATRLAALHARHPAWTFEPLVVHDMTWDAVVDKECTPAWNLVVYSSWAAQPWTSLGTANYTPYYDPAMKAYDSGSFYQASRAAVAYFMDPRNFLNDTEVFMFETLGYNAAAHTVAAIDTALTGSFMKNAGHDGGTETFAALLRRLGAQYDTSPVFLAGRLLQEQGNGTVQARGTIGTSLMELYADEDGVVGSSVIWGSRYTKTSANTLAIVAQGAAAYNGYYNFYNIKASGSGLFEIRYNAYLEATEAATVQNYGGPWNTQEKAIAGGTKKMKENYIDSLRHTRYLQKYSVHPASSKRWSQYMQNVGSPITEARATRKAYLSAGTLDAPWHFVIPVYLSMPAEACPDPANGNSVYSPTK